jgi:hypothetical protein
MLQLAANLCFFLKTPQRLTVAVPPCQQHLQRQLAPQRRIAAAQYRPHATATDLALHLEATQTPWRRGGIVPSF